MQRLPLAVPPVLGLVAGGAEVAEGGMAAPGLWKVSMIAKTALARWSRVAHLDRSKSSVCRPGSSYVTGVGGLAAG